MNADTIFFLNFGIHSVVLGAAGWLLVRLVIRDAMRRCLLANLALLFCAIAPFSIYLRDLSPVKQADAVWTPLRETFEADWRVTVAPPEAVVAPQATAVVAHAPAWNVNDLARVLRWLAWTGTAIMLGRLMVQCVGVQRWAWRLRMPSAGEQNKLPAGMEIGRIRVFDQTGTPCVAGWLFPVIAVPVSAFEDLTPTQWRWLMRHESEHLRCHDTVAVFLQHLVRAFVWWNPFVHALVEEYARAREEACDAAAVAVERQHTAYAEFLLTWAARPSSLPTCVMPMAQSLPARRLKARLTALMEARGVRKKAGALFVLSCLAFAVICPLFVASFGISTAGAQEAVAPKADDGKMHTRVYEVAPDFLHVRASEGKTAADEPPSHGLVSRPNAIQILKERGVPFPEGASAILLASTSKLIVRNTIANLALVENMIDKLHTRSVMVLFACKFIQADRFLGEHGEILSPEAAKDLVRSVSQTKGVNIMSAPSVTTKFGQAATVEVVREVLPKLGADGKPAGDLKLIGPRIQLLAKGPTLPQDTCTVNVDASLGVDLDDEKEASWLPSRDRDRAPDWDRVQVHTVTSQADMASGETLLLRLTTTQKPVTVLITAQALKLGGEMAGSFAETTLAAPPAREGRDVTEEMKVENEWATRHYRVPGDFGAGEDPVDYLKKHGIEFPPGAEAKLELPQLKVRNTRRNLDLIESVVEAVVVGQRKNDSRIKLVVQAVDLESGTNELMELLSPYTKPNPAPGAQVIEAARHQFTLQGILTEAQLSIVLRKLTKSGHEPVLLPAQAIKSTTEAVFEAAVGKSKTQLKVTPTIGADGNTIEMLLAIPMPGGTGKAITTAVTVWNGQTLIAAGQTPDGEKKTQVVFITATRVDGEGKPVKW